MEITPCEQYFNQKVIAKRQSFSTDTRIPDVFLSRFISKYLSGYVESNMCAYLSNANDQKDKAFFNATVLRVPAILSRSDNCFNLE